MIRALSGGMILLCFAFQPVIWAAPSTAASEKAAALAKEDLDLVSDDDGLDLEDVNFDEEFRLEGADDSFDADAETITIE